VFVCSQYPQRCLPERALRETEAEGYSFAGASPLRRERSAIIRANPR